MFEFPYMQIAGGIVRPIIAIAIEGPQGKRLLDGLVDTGADRTVFPQHEAAALGIQLPAQADGNIKTAGGVLIPFRLGEIILELRAAGSIVRWKTTIAFADSPLSVIHLGTRGFLEYFHCTFLGPEKKIQLTACPTLPSDR